MLSAGETAVVNGQALFLDKIRRSPSISPLVRAHMTEAARFRLEQNVTRILLDMVERDGLADNARYLFWPSSQTWIEGTITSPSTTEKWNLQFGMLYIGTADDNIKNGRLWFYQTMQEDTFIDGCAFAEYVIDLNNYSRPVKSRPSSDSSYLFNEQCEEHVTRIVVATLALLGSRRIYSTRHVAFDRLNVRRQRKGKWPLLAYNEVRISMSGTPPTVTPATGRGSPRPLHFVRAFLRLRQGRIELVSPHWRGDAQLGVKRPAYVITP